MANNTYTFSALKQAVQHVLGGVPDANLTADQVVNGAMSDFCTEVPWRWRQRTLSLASVSGQNYIALPTDFQELVTIKPATGTNGCAEPMTIDKITELRASGSTTLGYGSLAYCLDWQSQASVTAEPTPIVQLYPTPSTNSNPYIIGAYLCQIPKLVNPTDVPNIPSTFQEALMIYCRAYAVILETGQFGADYQKFMNMLPKLERLDGRSAGYLGRMRGGLFQSSASGAMGPITNPA